MFEALLKSFKSDKTSMLNRERECSTTPLVNMSQPEVTQLLGTNINIRLSSSIFEKIA
jgi:hypothetical protein